VSRGLLFVPPPIKQASGPLLGPALLKGAAEVAGHQVDVVDLNIRYLRDAGVSEHTCTAPPGAFGDHAPWPSNLPSIYSRFFDELTAAVPGQVPWPGQNPARALSLSHKQVYGTVGAILLEVGTLGQWLETQLAFPGPPSMVGVSVLYGGQVLPALALSAAAKAAYPEAPVIWGGTHVMALRDRIPHDPAFGQLVDGFVFGAAEQTFVELLEAIDAKAPWPTEVVRAGSGVSVTAKNGAAIPVFEDLDLYGMPMLNLPAQTQRGCPYGRCRYCTYPAIEGGLTDLGLVMLEAVVQLAEEHQAVVTLKDSLVSPRRLEAVGRQVAGRVLWAACTKVDRRLDLPTLRRLAEGGCHTLEFGLETLLTDTQTLIDKPQQSEAFAAVLGACADARVFPVVNVMTGFPGEPADAAAAMLDDVRSMVQHICGTRGLVKHNIFELAPLAALAHDPRIEIKGRWPWSSVLDWRRREETDG